METDFKLQAPLGVYITTKYALLDLHKLLWYKKYSYHDYKNVTEALAYMAFINGECIDNDKLEGTYFVHTISYVPKYNQGWPILSIEDHLGFNMCFVKPWQLRWGDFQVTTAVCPGDRKYATLLDYGSKHNPFWARSFRVYLRWQETWGLFVGRVYRQKRKGRRGRRQKFLGWVLVIPQKTLEDFEDGNAEGSKQGQGPECDLDIR